MLSSMLYGDDKQPFGDCCRILIESVLDRNVALPRPVVKIKI
jgi:hypothetical protein